MNRRSRYIFVFLMALGGAVLAAALMEALVVAGTLAALGVLVAILMAVAWMRPQGYPTEHHPRIDKLLDDTRP
jgi:hypothetical protein